MSWFCAMTQANAEAGAAARLRDQGYDVFLPEIHRMSRHARKVRMVRRAYFSRYLFVGFDPGLKPSSPINGTKGIVGLIGAPDPVPSSVIETMQAIASRNGGLMPTDDGEAAVMAGRPQFKRTDVLRITEGPFTGLEGLFDRNEGKRIAVLMELFRGGRTRVQFNPDQVQLVA